MCEQTTELLSFGAFFVLGFAVSIYAEDVCDFIRWYFEERKRERADN